MACQIGNVECLEVLLEEQPDLSFVNKSGECMIQAIILNTLSSNSWHTNLDNIWIELFLNLFICYPPWQVRKKGDNCIGMLKGTKQNDNNVLMACYM